MNCLPLWTTSNATHSQSTAGASGSGGNSRKQGFSLKPKTATDTSNATHSQSTAGASGTSGNSRKCYPTRLPLYLDDPVTDCSPCQADHSVGTGTDYGDQVNPSNRVFFHGTMQTH